MAYSRMTAARYGMYITMLALGATLAPSLVQEIMGSPNMWPDEGAKNPIEVHVVPSRLMLLPLKPGHSLDVRIEIWNLGKQDLFIGKNIVGASQVSTMKLYLTGGVALAEPGVGVAVDEASSPSQAFASVLSTHWTVLTAGHFYGTVFHMYVNDFPKLGVPGTYRLEARYSSVGFPEDGNINLLRVDPEQSKKLPYKAWEGQIDSNPISIKIVAPHKEH